MDIQLILKNYDQQHSIGLDQFTIEQLKDAFDNDGKYWLSKKEIDSIAKFMDPMDTGKISIKHFIELLNKDELLNLAQNYNINNSVFYAALVEGIEVEQ